MVHFVHHVLASTLLASALAAAPRLTLLFLAPTLLVPALLTPTLLARPLADLVFRPLPPYAHFICEPLPQTPQTSAH